MLNIQGAQRRSYLHITDVPERGGLSWNEILKDMIEEKSLKLKNMPINSYTAMSIIGCQGNMT